ncbi:MAG TPA: GPP34 family phosphoprotein [Acidimicrobiales bacterium]|jgi:hypothetical protein|nr:GPP34 family phosphoprotein [Acidimicrobiales bacterium]
MLIAEEFVLLALTPDGTPARSTSYQNGYSNGVTGALLTELELQGHLSLDDGRIRITGTTPDHPLLRQVLDETRSLDGKKLRSKLGLIRRSGWNEVVDGMIDAGILGRHRPNVLQPTRHPVNDPALHAAVIARVQAAATGDQPFDRRDATLLALAGPCQLLEIVAPDRSDRKHAKARIAEASRSVPAAEAVKYAISSRSAAVVAAST